MCESHWVLCRKAIQKRGLSHLVSKTQKEAVSRIKKDMRSETPTRDYDPMLHLVMFIYHKYIDNIDELDIENDDERHCPLCDIAKKVNKIASQLYLDIAADEIEEMCKKYNLQG